MNIYPDISKALKKVHDQPWNNTYECEEISREMQKKISDEIDQCIRDHQHLDFDRTFYIQIIHRKDNNFSTLNDFKIICRFSRPEPGPNMYLFSYSRKDGLKFEWCIAPEAIVEMVLTHPNKWEKFDHELIRIYQKYRDGILE